MTDPTQASYQTIRITVEDADSVTTIEVPKAQDVNLRELPEKGDVEDIFDIVAAPVRRRTAPPPRLAMLFRPLVDPDAGHTYTVKTEKKIQE